MDNNLASPDPLGAIAEYSLEIAVLLLAARNRPDTQALDALQALLCQPLNGSRLRFLARLNGVSPLLYQTFKLLASPEVPADLLQSMATEHNTRTFNNLMRTRQLIELVDGLAQAGILAIPFKGPVLAQSAYGDIALRIFADLDIWVHPQQVHAAEAWLLEHGFERRYQLQWESLFNQPQTALKVDLHHALTSHKFPFKLSFDQVAARLQPLSLAGYSLKQMSPEDTLLVQCVGWCKDAWGRSAQLAQLCDVAEVVRSHPQLDWDYVIAQAQRLDAYYITLLPLALAHDWLGIALPDPIWAKIQHSLHLAELKQHSSEQFWQYATHLPDASRGITSRDNRFYFGLRSSLWARTNYLRRQIFIPTEKERRFFDLPTRMAWGYIPLRLLRLLKKYSYYLFFQR